MIEIQDADFSMEEIEQLVAGAGILPFTIVNNEVYCLLGKERYVNHWRGSLKWSGFEGGRKANETIEEAASREFIEESLCCLSISGNEEENIASLSSFLRDKKYFTKITLCIIHEPPLEKRYHVTYLVYVSHTKINCVTKFEFERNNIINFESRWESLKELNRRIPDEYPYLREGHRYDDEIIDAIINVKVSNNHLEVEFTCNGNMKQIRFYTKNEHVFNYARWFHFRQELTTESTTIKSTCVRTTLNAINTIIDFKVHDEYLEKQSMRWWPIKDLCKVLRNGGHYNYDMFRAYFMPILQKSISELLPFQKDTASYLYK